MTVANINILITTRVTSFSSNSSRWIPTYLCFCVYLLCLHDHHGLYHDLHLHGFDLLCLSFFRCSSQLEPLIRQFEFRPEPSRHPQHPFRHFNFRIIYFNQSILRFRTSCQFKISLARKNYFTWGPPFLQNRSQEVYEQPKQLSHDHNGQMRPLNQIWNK